MRPIDDNNFLIEVTPEVMDEIHRLLSEEEDNTIELHYSPYGMHMLNGAKSPGRTHMSNTPVPTEGVEPVSEVDRVLLRLYLGPSFVELHTPAAHAKQMQNPALAEAKAAIERLIAEARLDELTMARDQIPRFIPRPIGQLQGKTAYNEYIKKRLAELNQMKGKTV